MAYKTLDQHSLKVFLAFSAIYVVWGSTFSMVTLALQSFPPLALSTIRFFIGGLLLTLYCVLKNEPWPKRCEIRRYAISGIVIFVGGVVAVVWAQQYITSSLASIIITTPFWFLILDRSNWRANFSSPYVPAGMVFCITGVITLLLKRQGQHAISGNDSSTLAILIMVFGSALWAGGSLYLKYKPGTASVMVRTSIQLLSAGVFCGLLCIPTHSFSTIKWEQVDLVVISAVLYLGIVSTTLTFIAFIWLMKHKSPSLVSTYSYVNPVVAVLLGAVILHEHVSITQIVAMVIILSGLFLINVPAYRKKNIV